MKTLLIAAPFLLTLIACGGENAAQPPPTTPQSPAGLETTAHASESEHHHHHDEAAPSGHHHSAHGGIVKMHAENGVHLHVEVVVAPSGLVRLYPSDGESKPIPATELAGSVTCETNDKLAKTKFDGALHPDPADGSAVVQCPALTSAGATVAFDVHLRGASFARSVTVGAQGTAGGAPE